MWFRTGERSNKLQYETAMNYTMKSVDNMHLRMSGFYKVVGDAFCIYCRFLSTMTKVTKVVDIQ